VAHRERETSGAGASALTRPWPARTPWWLLLVLGVGAVAIGLALCLDANAPLPEIFLLIALGFLVCGLDDLLILDEPRPRPVPVIIGVSFIVFGVLAAAWGPRYPVVLAYAIAGVLGLAGMGRILAPLLRGERTRLLTVTRGIVEIALAIIVFFVPFTTLVVLAIGFASASSCRACASGTRRCGSRDRRRRPRRPRRRRLIRPHDRSTRSPPTAPRPNPDPPPTRAPDRGVRTMA
jgi:hypothetical protein